MIIVGNGPSLKDKKRGDEIDSFQTVIRLTETNIFRTDHACYNIADHGRKTDYLIANTYTYKFASNVPKYETWIYSRPNELNDSIKVKIYNRLLNYNPVFVNILTDYWLNYFETIGNSNITKFRPIPQTGIIGIIISILKLKPYKLTLAGFDSYWDESMAVRGVHDLITERQLISEISTIYKTELIKF